MTINSRRFTVDATGLARGEETPLAFTRPVTIDTEGVDYYVRSAWLTVERRRQNRFVLPFTPVPGVIQAVVLNRKTYFEPDFSIRENELTWNGPVLPVGTQLLFESYGDATAIGHFRLERLVVTDPAEIVLDGTPVGRRTEIYVDGLCYPETAGWFSKRGNRLTWRNLAGPLTPGSEICVLYPRTVEGASLWMQESHPVYPGANRAVSLFVQPRPAAHTRLYKGGERYFYGDDFILTDATMTALGNVDFEHGGILTVMATASEQFFVKISDEVDMPEQFFAKATVTVTDGNPEVNTGFGFPFQGMSIGSLRGASYFQGFGFAMDGQKVTWQDADLALKAGDVLSVTGFLSERVGAALRIKELPVTPGYPTWDIGEKVAEIQKSLLFVSALDSVGGEMYASDRYLTFVDEERLRWNGPYALKAGDRAFVAFWKDPVVAADIKVGRYTVTMGEAGKPFAYRLPMRPKEAAQVIVSQNGQRLISPEEFVVSDGIFYYGIPSRPVKLGDDFMFVYR